MKKNLLLLSLFASPSSSHGSPSLFYIEGNTGSGKTTLLRALSEKNKDFITLEEPVDIVQNIEGINALSLLYQDQKKWSLTVNLLYCLSHTQRLKKIIKDNPNGTIVSDRSLYSERAFCYADKISGHLHPLEAIVYNKIADLAAASVPKPTGFIYIRTKPEVSFERISKRKRKEESDVPLEYWKILHEGHEHMFFEDTLIKEIPLLVIDYNEDGQIQEAVQKIENFIFTCRLHIHQSFPE